MTFLNITNLDRSSWGHWLTFPGSRAEEPEPSLEGGGGDLEPVSSWARPEAEGRQ